MKLINQSKEEIFELYIKYNNLLQIDFFLMKLKKLYIQKFPY